MSLINTLEKSPKGERRWDVKRNPKGRIIEVIMVYRPNLKDTKLLTDVKLLEILKEEKKK